MRQIPVGPEVDSFYHLAGVELEHRFCQGLGCFAARNLNRERWDRAITQWPPVYCLGKCYTAPSTTDADVQPVIEIRSKEPVVLAGLAHGEIKSLSDYRLAGGYQALEKALKMPPVGVIAEVEASHLRGRGGAGFPAGRKWRAVYSAKAEQKYVVANADEGDHGSYIDRFIMEYGPHRLLEALTLAGYAVGANKGYIYLRKEYPEALTALSYAIEEASSAHWLGPNLRGSEFGFSIEIVLGQGSYVCGEETSLLNSIEHRRPEVRSRPPFPTESGLFGRPTLVNNVETLASVPWIVLNGGAAYAAMGYSTSRGTKAVSFASLFNRPGLYEVDFGISCRELLEDIGGGLKTGDFKAVMVGGPLAGVIHPREFDTPFAFDEMHAIGAAVGHGGIVGFDDSTRMVDLLAHIFSFGAVESCGKCTPCRVGSRIVEKMLRSASRGEKIDRAEFDRLVDALRKTSLCGHGVGLGDVAVSVISKFEEEFQPCFT